MPSNGTSYVKPQVVGRIQNIQLFNMYNAKKQAISTKNIPSLQSTMMLMQNGAIDTFFSDNITNEFYMWHYAPNAVEITNGAPLRDIKL